MYKQAAQQKLRFATSRGSLSVEQLFDLPISELDTLAVALDESYKNSKGKSFVEKRTSKDKTIKLQFDIVLDVLNTKVDERDSARDLAADKAHNNKILELIASKKDEDLKGKSVKELEAMLK
jgi:hypothetical protein